MLSRVLIFGNSGSGKSTLAKSLSQSEGLVHFDLDTIAWLPINPPERAPISGCAEQISQFLAAHQAWVIEGCYGDLIELVTAEATEVIFLNLEIDDCIFNARNRSWEPHKYESKKLQDANLDMLLGWIATYRSRDDTCSFATHSALFERFQGKKKMITKNKSDKQR